MFVGDGAILLFFIFIDPFLHALSSFLDRTPALLQTLADRFSSLVGRLLSLAFLFFGYVDY